MLRPVALLLVALAVATAASAQAQPSFPCPLDGSAVEHWICDDPDLARADVEAARFYNVLAAKQTDSRPLAMEQRQWLHEVRNHCDSPGCVAEAYARRTAELQARNARIVDLRDAPWKPLLERRIDRVDDVLVLRDITLRSERPRQLRWEFYPHPSEFIPWTDHRPAAQQFCHPPDRREGYASRFGHRSRAGGIEFIPIERAHGRGYILARLQLGTDLPLHEDILCQFGFSELALQLPSMLYLVEVEQ